MKLPVKTYLLLLAGIFYGLTLEAQTELKPVTDPATIEGLSSLLNKDNKVERVALVSNNEREVKVTITCKGFDDKTYKVEGVILNASKQPIADITTGSTPLPANKQTDLIFTLQEKGTTYSGNNLTTKYLLIRVVPEGTGALNTLLGELGGTDISLGSVSFLYELDKTWQLQGSKITVNVPLNPYKSAATIQQ